MKNNYTKLGVVIDMNEGFVNQGAMANPTYNKLVPEQLRVIDKVRSEGGEIMFINEGHNPNSVEFNTYPAHCVLGTPEVELIPEFTFDNSPSTLDLSPTEAEIALFLADITSSNVDFSCLAYPFTVSTKLGIKSYLFFKNTSIVEKPSFTFILNPTKLL